MSHNNKCVKSQCSIDDQLWTIKGRTTDYQWDKRGKGDKKTTKKKLQNFIHCKCQKKPPYIVAKKAIHCTCITLATNNRSDRCRISVVKHFRNGKTKPNTSFRNSKTITFSCVFQQSRYQLTPPSGKNTQELHKSVVLVYIWSQVHVI